MEYRCENTVDLEEVLEMAQSKYLNYEIAAIYKSGRREVIRGKLKQRWGYAKKSLRLGE